MARNGSGEYSLPANTAAVSGATISSTKFNSIMSDLESTLNTARPVVKGGTGATTASDARTNLGLAIGSDVQAYDAFLDDIAGLTDPGADSVLIWNDTSNAVEFLAQSSFLLAANNLSDVTASTARSNLGLGALAVLGSVNNDNWSGTDLAVANGGTGASDASTARSNLGAYGSGDNVSFGTLTASGDANFDSNTLFVDVSENAVVIGGTTVRNGLTVIKGSGVLPTAGNHAGGLTVGYTANWGLDIGALSSGRSFIQSHRSDTTATTYDLLLQPLGGSVGIGTTSPDHKLSVFEDSNGNRTEIGIDNTDQRIVLGAYFESGVGQYSTIQSTNNAETTAQALIVQPDGGNVGIGTTSPNEALHVNGETQTKSPVVTTSGTLSQTSHLEGHVINMNGNVTLPTAAAGCHCVLIAAGGARTITRGSGLALYVNGTNTASVSLADRKACSVVYTSGSSAYLTGDVT